MQKKASLMDVEAATLRQKRQCIKLWMGFWQMTAEKIVAGSGYHRDLRAAQARGWGLVCAFAAEAHVETIAENGFTGTREDVGEGHEADVTTADYAMRGGWVIGRSP